MVHLNKFYPQRKFRIRLFGANFVIFQRYNNVFFKKKKKLPIQKILREGLGGSVHTLSDVRVKGSKSP